MLVCYFLFVQSKHKNSNFFFVFKLNISCFKNQFLLSAFIFNFGLVWQLKTYGFIIQFNYISQLTFIFLFNLNMLDLNSFEITISSCFYLNFLILKLANDLFNEYYFYQVLESISNIEENFYS